MAENVNLETKERLFKEYSHFVVGETNPEKAFIPRQGGKYKGGVPLAYDEERNLIAIDASDTHTLVWGSTGSLKTRCVIEPAVKIIGKSGESMIINDPKAEIHNRCAAELKEEGYHVIVINIRDPEFGNSWNPLAIPYRFYLQGDLDRAAEFANDVAHNLMMEEVSTKDPFWDYSASDCLFGLILFLFRYAKDHHLDESAVNMSSLMKLRQQLFKNVTSTFKAQSSLLWKYAAEDELVEASLSGSIYAPNDTRNSILSVFDQKMRAFIIRPSLLDMLANNDIDLGEIGEKKVAVFLIIPDEKSTYNNLVSLFVKQAYEYLIYKASSNEDLKLRHRVNFVLDEFSSLPPISSMSTLISAARSRDIRFLLAVQGKHQLIKRYGDEAETIKSNCVNWIYLTSREVDLLKEISDLCGEQRNRTPNLSVYDLQHFSKQKGEALVLCGRMKPARVNLLDIDRFGDSEYTIPDFERLPRRPRQNLSFELSEEIRKRLAPVLGGSPADESPLNPFTLPERPRFPERPASSVDSKPGETPGVEPVKPESLFSDDFLKPVDPGKEPYRPTSGRKPDESPYRNNKKIQEDDLWNDFFALSQREREKAPSEHEPVVLHEASAGDPMEDLLREDWDFMASLDNTGSLMEKPEDRPESRFSAAPYPAEPSENTGSSPKHAPEQPVYTASFSKDPRRRPVYTPQFPMNPAYTASYRKDPYDLLMDDLDRRIDKLEAQKKASDPKTTQKRNTRRNRNGKDSFPHESFFRDTEGDPES